MNKDLIEQEFTTTEQKWSFNPPTASHMGVAWERLIRTVKSGLKQITRTRTPTQEMLESLLVELEGIINSRPLTYGGRMLCSTESSIYYNQLLLSISRR